MAVQDQTVEKVSEILSQQKKPGMEENTCNPNYMRGIGRLITIWGKKQNPT
jgi:hypothetical protein